jgi:signal transduction histidine kinase
MPPAPMAFIRTQVLNALHSRAVIYATFTVLPIVIMIIGEQIALPGFVFEHLMVIVVVAAAVAGGRGPAVASAVSGGVGDNLLLPEPIGAITGVRDAVDLGLFLLVAVVVGWLVNGLRTARVNAVAAACREQEAREELDRLVATVTHDLATPLTAIRGTIQFARKHAVLTEVDTVRLLGRIETAAVRATSLVRALADTKSIARQSLSLELQSIDVRTVVEPIAKMLDRTSDRHPIGLAMDPSPLVVNGDAERLGRVVENLITNAIKYSPGGGAIEVQLREDDGDAVLTIRDYGIDISAEARDRVVRNGIPGSTGGQCGAGSRPRALHCGRDCSTSWRLDWRERTGCWRDDVYSASAPRAIFHVCRVCFPSIARRAGPSLSRGPLSNAC